MPEVLDTCVLCGASHWVRRYRLRDFMHRTSDVEMEVFECGRCHQLSLDVDQSGLASAYPASEYYAYQAQPKPGRVKRYLYRSLFKGGQGWRRAVGFPVRQLMRGIDIRAGEPLLDVGCGGGRFLALVGELGMRPFGVDMDETACRQASTVAEAVFCSQFEGFRPDTAPAEFPSSFPVITSNHVIEHVADPGIFLNNIARWLSPEGVAIIATPNHRSWWARLFGRYWAGLDAPRHLHILDPVNLAAYASAAGLRVIGERHVSSEYGAAMSVMYILESQLGIAPRRWARGLALNISRPLLAPIYTAANLASRGDIVEYTLSHTDS